MKNAEIQSQITSIKKQLQSNPFDIQLQMELANLEAQIEPRWSPEK